MLLSKYRRKEGETYTYIDSRDFSPWKASAATFLIWLLLKSLWAKNRKHKSMKRFVRSSNKHVQCTYVYVLEQVSHECHSHSSQFSIRREGLGWNFRDAVLFQPPAANRGKTNYRNKLTNMHTYSSGRFITRRLSILRFVLFPSGAFHTANQKSSSLSSARQLC